ncbi:hypothetical protein K504DRAFT_414171 [Pleomassaria siparia CBS 279.74]|uniref:DUF7730 domain-containing protein n=1 Tax=Pleomassaria siparia CBS 279.74 TaxID=1314801 RepID=A0A6G1JZJ5_9PLEO|nr:hypothetical protein K504DRAFT_414171 [Pleomassaria siparia CBS 279.74]
MSTNPPVKGQWVQSYKENPTRVGFLDLPAELREYIYDFAFRVQGTIFVYSDHRSRWPIMKGKIVKNKNEGPLEPRSVESSVPIALLRSCRQVHAESCGVLYGNNTYQLWMSHDPFTPFYQSLVRHLVFMTDTDHRIYGDDLETVGYWWRKRGWPDVIEKSTRLLQRFPGLESLTMPIQLNRYGRTWRPAFLSSDQKTREQRVAYAASWLAIKCPWEDERLRKLLHLEIMPASGLSKEAFEGSRFAPEDKWDWTEFADAFERMKSMSVTVPAPKDDHVMSSIGSRLSQVATTILAIRDAGQSRSIGGSSEG